MAIPWINVEEFDSAIRGTTKKENKICGGCSNRKKVVSSNIKLKYKCMNCDEK